MAILWSTATTIRWASVTLQPYSGRSLFCTELSACSRYCFKVGCLPARLNGIEYGLNKYRIMGPINIEPAIGPIGSLSQWKSMSSGREQIARRAITHASGPGTTLQSRIQLSSNSSVGRITAEFVEEKESFLIKSRNLDKLNTS